jgi:6-phospho-3-hexuloisomerase
MNTQNNDPVASTLDDVLAEVAGCVRRVSIVSLAQAVEVIGSSPRIFVAGAGRSGLCMRALAMRLMHLGKTVFVAGETTTPSIAATDLLLLGSGSGRTTSLLAMAGQAQRQGARILLFTTDAASPLAELADLRVLIPAPSFMAAEGVLSRNSVQPLGTLFEQSLLILCDSLILLLMQRTGVTTEQMFARHANLE